MSLEIGRDESDAELQEFLKNPNYIHYVGAFIPPRPGVRLCMVKLEHRHFTPGTQLNDEFFLRLIPWQEMLFGLVSIPIAKKGLMEEAAKETGLRIANGVPHLFDRGKTTSFPFSNERVFTLENTPGHPVYSHSVTEMLRAENEEVARILSKSNN